MQVTYEVTADDYRHALLTYRDRNFYSRWGAPALVAFFVLWAILQGALLFTRPYQEWLTWCLPLTLGSIIFLSFTHWAGPHFNARRQFNSTPTAKEKVSPGISDTGLHFRGPSTDAAVGWTNYVKWMEDDSVFVLFPAPKIFVLVPKRAFTLEQLTQFRDLLQRKISA